MYLDSEGKFLTSNGIILLAFKEGTISRYGENGLAEEPADFALGWDALTKEYKCYAKPETNGGPGHSSNNYDEEETIKNNRALKALAYGNTISLERAKEVFTHIDFVEDYLESDGGYEKRLPEYFV